jgi:hypothetical protein
MIHHAKSILGRRVSHVNNSFVKPHLNSGKQLVANLDGHVFPIVTSLKGRMEQHQYLVAKMNVGQLVRWPVHCRCNPLIARVFGQKRPGSIDKERRLKVCISERVVLSVEWIQDYYWLGRANDKASISGLLGLHGVLVDLVEIVHVSSALEDPLDGPHLLVRKHVLYGIDLSIQPIDDRQLQVKVVSVVWLGYVLALEHLDAKRVDVKRFQIRKTNVGPTVDGKHSSVDFFGDRARKVDFV